MNTHRVLIVDDHPIVRSGLRVTLGRRPDLEVVGEATNGREAVQAVAQVTPHIVLMDLTMPEMNGIEATKEIKRRYPDVRVVIVTMHDSVEYAQASLEAGADGYVTKDAGSEELQLAISTALQGVPLRGKTTPTGIAAG